ncbi:MAG TPA: hypothetical protein VLL52_14920 [Anaerolineae bacterium]|nr:hypothetical protein [Anaerolineae bacterium]
MKPITKLAVLALILATSLLLLPFIGIPYTSLQALGLNPLGYCNANIPPDVNISFDPAIPNSIFLDWSTGPLNPETYEVLRATTPHFSPLDTNTTTLISNYTNTTYTDVGINDGSTSYYYIVQATNSCDDPPAYNSDSQTSIYHYPLTPGTTALQIATLK